MNMNKIILFHYLAILAILGFGLSMTANLIPVTILSAILFAACAILFAKAVQEKDAHDRRHREKHHEAHKRIRERFDKLDDALKQKMDKPKNTVRAGSKVSPEYIKMLAEKGVEVVDDRAEDQAAP